jgi:hypothetical protein
MAADPRLLLRNDGMTTKPAAYDNVFAFGPGGPSGVTQIAHGPGGYFHGYYVRFDVRFSTDVHWLWRPCDPSHGRPCTGYSDRNQDGETAMDLQDVATHEWGHVVGLEHASVDSADDELTMWGQLQNASRLCSPSLVCRWRDTLALGMMERMARDLGLFIVHETSKFECVFSLRLTSSCARPIAEA